MVLTVLKNHPVTISKYPSIRYIRYTTQAYYPPVIWEANELIVASRACCPPPSLLVCHVSSSRKTDN